MDGFFGNLRMYSEDQHHKSTKKVVIGSRGSIISFFILLYTDTSVQIQYNTFYIIIVHDFYVYTHTRTHAHTHTHPPHSTFPYIGVAS